MSTEKSQTKVFIASDFGGPKIFILGPQSLELLTTWEVEEGAIDFLHKSLPPLTVKETAAVRDYRLEPYTPSGEKAGSGGVTVFIAKSFFAPEVFILTRAGLEKLIVDSSSELEAIEYLHKHLPPPSPEAMERIRRYGIQLYADKQIPTEPSAEEQRQARVTAIESRIRALSQEMTRLQEELQGLQKQVGGPTPRPK